MNPGDESHRHSLPTGGKLRELRHLRAGLQHTEKKIYPQVRIPTQTPTVPSSVLHAHKFAHLHSSLTHPYTHFALDSTLTHLQVTSRVLTSTPHTRWPPDFRKHTRSPLQEHSCPASSRKHTLTARQASPGSRSPSNPRGRVLSLSSSHE